MEENQNDDLSVVCSWVQLKCKIIAKSSLKFFFYALVIMLDILLESVALMFVGGILLVLGFCVFITTPIWTMFLLITWIPTVIMVLVIMYSKIGENLIRFIKKKSKWLFYDSTRPRRWVWARYYDICSWIYPEDSFYIMNCGYSLLSEDGLLNKFESLDHEVKEIYQYQLYYYVANLYGSDNLTGKKIIDLGCGRGGGTYFMYSYFKPKKIYGVDIASYHIQACRDTFVKEEQKSLIQQRKKLRTTIAKKYSLNEAEIKVFNEMNRSRTQSMSTSMKIEKSDNLLIENSLSNKEKSSKEEIKQTEEVGEEFKDKSKQKFNYKIVLCLILNLTCLLQTQI